MCSRGHWRPAEDDKLGELVEHYGPHNWNAIADNLRGRSGKSCRLRWFNQLDPRINKSPFTEEEEERLIACHRIHGNRWAVIARLFPGRTDNAVKNHWHVMMARLRRRQRQTQTQTQTQIRSSKHPHHHHPHHPHPTNYHHHSSTTIKTLPSPSTSNFLHYTNINSSVKYNYPPFQFPNYFHFNSHHPPPSYNSTMLQDRSTTQSVEFYDFLQVNTTDHSNNKSEVTDNAKRSDDHHDEEVNQDAVRRDGFPFIDFLSVGTT